MTAGLARRSDQEKFDRFTKIAARALGVPIVSLSLVGPRRGVVTSSAGLPAPLVLLLAHRFCRHVALSRRPLVIGDARRHPLGAKTPAVRDGLVTAYAGLPLFDPRGRTLGTLCAMDTRPRAWTRAELERLHDVAWVLRQAVDWRPARRPRHG
ncbi:MAG TPA: GAF domain-containing protein [Gemmatimonadales bacterium]|jgi:GAF domain-containing protein